MFISKIKIEGFRSIRLAEFNFEHKGVHVVQGENGVGKSTLFEALYYAIFGDSIKSTPVSELQTLKKYRGANYQGLRVELYFAIGDYSYKVIRMIDYGPSRVSDVEFFKNGTRVGTDNKTDAQSKINAVIGISSNLFKNSVFFAQKSMRLVDSKDADRREVFDELFEVSLEDAQRKAKEAHADVEAGIQKLVLSKEQNDREIVRYRDGIAANEEVLKNFNTEQTRKISLIQQNLKNLREQLANRPTDVIERLPVDAPDERPYFECRLMSQKISADLQAAKSRKESLKKPDESCAVCGSPLKEAKVKELVAAYKESIIALNEEILRLEDSLAVANLRTTEARLAVDFAKKDFQDYQEYLTTQNVELMHIQKLESSIQAEERLLAEIQNQKCTITEQSQSGLRTTLQSFEMFNTTLEGQISELKLKAVDYLYWATEGFSNKGLKAHIVNAMLVRLNSALALYGEQLGILVSFNIKMDTKTKGFDIVITDVNGVEKSYTALSGGEQKRVDIIVSFALHDILSKQISLIVMDEIFEGLDEKGQDIAMALIRNKSMHQAVYLICHNINLDLSQANIINIQKQNNETIVTH